MAAKTIELKAGTVTVENKSKKPQNVNVYIPNKENMPCTLNPGDKLVVETRSAGETYSYLVQADADLAVTVAAAAADGGSGDTTPTTPTTPGT